MIPITREAWELTYPEAGVIPANPLYIYESLIIRENQPAITPLMSATDDGFPRIQERINQIVPEVQAALSYQKFH